MKSTPLTTKPHYPILDGLRGVAAVLVVIFHILEAQFLDYSKHPLHHAYLAVDFFFLLSGFVIGYAYDDRWERMTTWEFFKIRLVRLQPMVVLAVLFGAVCFWLDPYTAGAQHTSILKLIGVILLSFALLPAPDIRGWVETHPLVGPLWSLLQEYIANVIYGFFGKKMSKVVLWIIVIISATALTIVAVRRGDVATGWSYETFWIAIVRMMFPFFGGLLLFRVGKLIHVPAAFTVCAGALTLLFILPYFKYNGLYEAACIIIGFPIIVAAGAGGKIKGSAAKICKFLGDISYPLYIIHYPIIYIYTAWLSKEKPTPNQYIPVAIGSFFLMLLIGYVSLKLYDEPVRKWLKNKVLGKAK